MDYTITVHESFDDNEELLFEKIEKKQFDSKALFDLKLDAQEFTKETEVNTLFCSDLINRTLEY